MCKNVKNLVLSILLSIFHIFITKNLFFSRHTCLRLQILRCKIGNENMCQTVKKFGKHFTFTCFTFLKPYLYFIMITSVHL
jgi:hypothetical protein